MHHQQGVAAFSQAHSPGIPNFNSLYQAQVIGVVPEEHAVTVILPSLTTLAFRGEQGGLKVSVMSRRAGNFVGEVNLPRVGDWGVVAFVQGSHALPVWLGSIYQTYAGLAVADAQERIDHHDSGVYSRITKDGDMEWSHPSGTYVRVGASTALSARTRRKKVEDASEAERVAYDIPEKPVPQIHVEHPSGTTITIDTDGNISIVGAQHVDAEVAGNINAQVGGNVTAEVIGNVSAVVGGNVAVNATGNIVAVAAQLMALYGQVMTNIGAESGQDFVALLQALTEIKSTFDAHIHPGGAPPTTQMPTWTPGVHVSEKVRAS